MTVAIYLPLISVVGDGGGGESAGCSPVVSSFSFVSASGSFTSYSSRIPSTSSVAAILPIACTGSVEYAGAISPHLEYA